MLGNSIAAILVAVVAGSGVPRSFDAPFIAADNWTLTPVILRESAARGEEFPIWLGLKNESSEARMVCVAGWDVAMSSSKGDEGLSHGASPHACQNTTSSTIVLAGETLHTLALVKFRRYPLSVNSALSVGVTIFEWILTAPSRTEERVVWSGTAKDASQRAVTLRLITK
jgi:hypothetical protein